MPPIRTEAFPYVLVRVAGGNFMSLECLNLTDSGPIYDTLEFAREHDHRAEEAHSVIERIIGEEKDQKRRIQLLTVNRNISRTKEIEPLGISFDAKLNRKLNEYKVSLKRHTQSHSRFEKFYTKEVSRISKDLKAQSRNEVLRKGLGLSSVSLLKGIDNSYTKKDEKGLFKYVTRYCAKTTPYSTLTQLALGNAGPHTNICSCSLMGESLIPEGHIRLSGAVLEWLLVQIANDPEVSGQVTVRLNPTLSIERTNYVFLVNFRNVEAFQVLESAPMLEFLRSILGSAANAITFNELGRIVSDVSQSPENEVQDYLRKLLDTGFIEFDIPVSGIDPDWLGHLIQYLSSLDIHGDKADELLSFLRGLQTASQTFGEARSWQREAILRDVHSRINAFWVPAQSEQPSAEPVKSKDAEPQDDDRVQGGDHASAVPVPKQPSALVRTKPFALTIKEESVLYEDAKFPGEFQLSQNYLSERMELLSESFKRLTVLDQWNNQNGLASFFRSRYANESSVPLLSFYRDYYGRGGNPNANAGAQSGKQNNERKEALETLLKDFETTYAPSGQEYRLSFDKLSHLDVSQSPKLASSFAVFAQIAHEDSGPNYLVLNSIVQGYGKFVGRFLHLFDPCVTQDFLEANNAAGNGGLMVENRDSSFFNANVHPALLPYEIWAPGSNTMLESNRQVPVTDLVVKRCEDDRLEVWSQKLHCPALILDLGFQNPMARSQLFRLLTILCPNQIGGFWTLTNAINTKVSQRPQRASALTIRPRVTLDDKVVIQRKSWFLQRNMFPVRQSSEREHSYYLRIFDWWKQQKLPNEVFIRMYYQQGNTQTSPEKDKAKPWRMDDRKPQYFNIMSPLSVSMFGDMLSRSASSLGIEEMLPRSDQLLPIGKEKRVIEYVIHHYDKK